MDSLLLAVILILFLLILYKPACEYMRNGDEDFEGTKVKPADMISFRSADPIKSKYTMNHSKDSWGLNNAEKYYDNLVYFNQGLSMNDPVGGNMFDDPAGSPPPPLPGMSTIDRLGFEVLKDQLADPSGMTFAAPLMTDSMEELAN